MINPEKIGGKAIQIGLVGSALLVLGLPVVGLIWRGMRVQAWQQIRGEAVRQALILSLTTTLISVAIIILIGTPLAYMLARRRFAGRRIINILIELPVVLPPAVAGLSLLVTFGRRGLVNETLKAAGVGVDINLAFTQLAVVLAQVFVASPFYIRAAQSGFDAVEQEIEESARVDGAAPLWVFFYVTLPLTSRALLAGALLSWARALGEFGATIIFAGSLAGRTRTIPLLIYSQLDSDINTAVWTALLLVLMAVIAAGLTRLIARRDPFK